MGNNQQIVLRKCDIFDVKGIMESSFINRDTIPSQLQQTHMEDKAIQQIIDQSIEAYLLQCQPQQQICETKVCQKNQDIRASTQGEKIEIITRHYWHDIQSMNNHISNVIKLFQICDIKIFQQFKTDNSIFMTQCILKEKTSTINKSELKANQEMFLDLLVYISKVIVKINNIWIEPKFILYSESSFLLSNFRVRQLNKQKLICGFIHWMYSSKQEDQFATHVDLSNELLLLDIPIYLRQIYKKLIKLPFCEFIQFLQKFKQKLIVQTLYFDSFHSCLLHKKIKDKGLYQNDEWIIAKVENLVFFYNILDKHCCRGKIIRKNRKIQIEDRCILFDKDQLQIQFITENAKFLVKASQFELQQHSSLSDIEIKYKFPVKFHNPMLIHSNFGEIYILENLVYKYSPNRNKLTQQTRKIADAIYLSSSFEAGFIVIRNSIDIFRNGISVFFKGSQSQLKLAGNLKVLKQLASIRVDIRTIQFCSEIYRGVYLMMANKNLWIIDLNFKCFWSYASMQRVKDAYGFTKNSIDLNSSYVFEIVGQPFYADFLKGHGELNICISENIFHTIGKAMGRLYYLKYEFQVQTGKLILKSYKPLVAKAQLIEITSFCLKKQTMDYKFNFHQQNAHLYKYEKWIFRGSIFLDVYDFNIQWNKTNYKVSMKVQPTEISLKDSLELMKKQKKALSHSETIVLIYKIYTFFHYLVENCVNHKTFNISNIYFTRNKQLKLIGWSEPPRSWYISDYKDFLLVCFNIITNSSYQKITQKILQKYDNQLVDYPVIQQQLHYAFKNSKTAEKKPEVQKNLYNLKQFLERSIWEEFKDLKGNKFIFSFQFNTPRFNMVDTSAMKIKKMVVASDPEQEEFTFHESDKFAWNQFEGKLYILTYNFKFIELKINTLDFTEEKLQYEDYQYLPNNISHSSLCYIPNRGLYSFGGIEKSKNGDSIFSSSVFKFNWEKLTWQEDGQLPQPRVNSHVVLSICGNFVFIMGGQIDLRFEQYQMIVYKLDEKTAQIIYSPKIENPFNNLHYKNPVKIFHLSNKLNCFMFWYMAKGFFNIKYIFGLKCGFQIAIQTRHFMEDQQSVSNISVSFGQNQVHLLRNYGKYSKIIIQKLSSLSTHSQTLYKV